MQKFYFKTSHADTIFYVFFGLAILASFIFFDPTLSPLPFIYFSLVILIFLILYLAILRPYIFSRKHLLVDGENLKLTVAGETVWSYSIKSITKVDPEQGYFATRPDKQYWPATVAYGESFQKYWRRIGFTFELNDGTRIEVVEILKKYAEFLQTIQSVNPAIELISFKDSNVISQYQNLPFSIIRGLLNKFKK